MLLLQMGVPGGPELLVIFVVLFLFGLPVLLVGLLLAKRGSGGDRVEELERRVEELERDREES